MKQGSLFQLPPETRSQRGTALLKWPGNKTRLLHKLVPLLPVRFGRYHEPFLGSGALFFALEPKEAFLSDVNPELISLYRVVQAQPDLLIQELAQHKDTSEHYYRVRALDPEGLTEVARAARLLYLNRTCFNGVYRVNASGRFNVPYGRRRPGEQRGFLFPNAIWAAHYQLAKATVRHEDFEVCAERARARDFIYLDPPYAGLCQGGHSYNPGGFSDNDQKRVAALMRILDRRGCFVMASNSDSLLARQLYQGFDIQTALVRRHVGGACLTSTVRQRNHHSQLRLRSIFHRSGDPPPSRGLINRLFPTPVGPVRMMFCLLAPCVRVVVASEDYGSPDV